MISHQQELGDRADGSIQVVKESRTAELVGAAEPKAVYRVGADSDAFGVFLRALPTPALEFIVRKRFGLA